MSYGAVALPETDTCKQFFEVTVPVNEVESQTEQVIESLKQKVRLPGFRPGKVPGDLIRRRYQDEIRHEVLDKLLPKYFWKRAEDEGLAVVGTPNITEVHFEKGEPLRFKAEFEIAPTFELQEFKGLEVEYQEPEVTDADVDARIGMIREQKAQFVNLDPRPVADGDHAVVSLASLAGVDPPINQDEMTLQVGADDTLREFNENLLGMSPGDEKEFDVHYPDDYGQPRVAGKTIRFHAKLKGLRRKELPELNDEFAQEVGDYRTVDELREAVRNSLQAERQFFAQEAAKHKLVEKLVEMHEFPVPEAFVESQIEVQVERQLRSMAADGIDPRKIRLDWDKVKASQRERAVKEVKASLVVNRIADAEGIHTTNEEVDREVHRIARQEREPAAAVRKRLEKENGLQRIASRIRTEKTLNFLFEHARKVAPAG
jgi:trigger factor